MSCHICSQQPNGTAGLYCVTCARNQLYALHLGRANILLERSSACQNVEQVMVKRKESNPNHNHNHNHNHHEGDVSSSSDTTTTTLAKQQPSDPVFLSMQRVRTANSLANARTQGIQCHVEELRRKIKLGREEIAGRRAALARRGSSIRSIKGHVDDRRTTALSHARQSISNTAKPSENLHGRIGESAIFLCREASSLYGLRQKTRRKNGVVVNSYSIGGVNITDLREMNCISSSQLNTSLAHICRLLVLVSHYLGLRLPAEIVLPNRDRPLPYILTPSSSYTPHDPFRTRTKQSPSPTSSSNNGGPLRATEGNTLSRPRPLFVDRTLLKLAKDDPAGYSMAIEAIALLAWDISWLCWTQGLSTASETWDDVYDIGRNLWLLLVAPPALVRSLTGRDQQQQQHQQQQQQHRSPPAREATQGRNISPPSRQVSSTEYYSHGTAHSFLGSAEGMEFMSLWKLPSPTKIADKLKSTLSGKMANAEWELLDDVNQEHRGVSSEVQQ